MFWQKDTQVVKKQQKYLIPLLTRDKNEKQDVLSLYLNAYTYIND